MTVTTTQRPQLPHLRTSYERNIRPVDAPSVTMKAPTRAHKRSNEVIPSVIKYFLQNWPFHSRAHQEEFENADLGLFACLCMPDALDDRIEMAAKTVSVLFLMDDVVDKWSMEEARAFKKDFREISGGTSPSNPQSPYSKVVAELFSSIRARDTTDSQLGRDFCVEVFTWFNTTVGQQRSLSASMGLEEYLKFRIIDSGYWLTIALMRWSMNLNVPPAIRAHHLVVGLEEIAGYQASVVNDLYSYRREMTMAKALQGDSVGASMVNAVVTVMTVARIGEQDAVNKLERYVEQLDEQFQGLMDEIALNDELKSEEKALVLHYSKALQFLMTGNLKWSKVCGRYNRTLVV